MRTKKSKSICISFLFMLAILMFLSLSGCGAKLPWPLEENSIMNIYNDDDVILSISEGSLSGLGCTYILENNGDTDIFSNEVYYVQIWKNDKWNQIESESSFPAIESWTRSGEKSEKAISWEFLYGELPAGKYRLLVSFQFNDTLSGSEYYVATEFSV